MYLWTTCTWLWRKKTLLFQIEIIVHKFFSRKCGRRDYSSSSKKRGFAEGWGKGMDEWTIKTPNLICRFYFEIDLLTDFAALCLTDFIDWRYIHSVVCIFDPGCELLPPWIRNNTCVLYCCPSTVPSLWPPPLPKLKCIVQYIQTVCVTGGGGRGGLLNCAVDHILQ